MYVPKAFVLLAMAVSASAISTQHIARNVHHRRHAVAARDASPEIPSATVVVPSVVPRKRQIKRCKAGNPTSSLLSSSAVPTSSAVVSSSVDIVPTSSAANNVGAAPSSSSVAVPTSETAAPSSSPVPVLPASAAPAPSSSVDPVPSSSPIPPVPTTSSVAPIIATTSSTLPPAPSSSKAPSSSVAPVATPSTSSEKPAPTTHTPTQTPASSAPASAPSPSSSSGNGDLLTSQHSGDGTWYETGLGACGITNVDTDFIVAVSHLLFDSFPGYDGANPNNNPICNKKATANWGGKSVSVTITDRCTGCDFFSLDFSPSAFSQLADQSVGRLTGMTWMFDL